MLSQRSVAKFELFYAAMLQPPFYGSSSLLNAGVYANELYGEGLPNALLHKLYTNTDFNHPFARALYEGVAVADALGRHSILDKDRQLGTTYLLVAMAVAIRFYRSASYDAQEQAREYFDPFLNSLAQDGYTYSGGKMYNSVTGEAIHAVSLNGVPPQSVMPVKLEPVAPEILPAPESVEIKAAPQPRTLKLLVSSVVTLCVPTFFWILSIFNNDFHDWLAPKLHSFMNLLSRLIK